MNPGEPKDGVEIATAGVRIGAAGVGGYLSAVMGPEAGASAGQALSEAGEAIVRNVLEGRPRERIVRVLQRAAKQVAERRENGEEPREEIADPAGEDAAAIFEAVVDSAARSFEQRKAMAIANFYASLAFDESVSISDAMLYLKRIREMSWRQLIAMRYFEDMDREQERLSNEASIGEAKAGVRVTLADELSEMFRALGVLAFEKTPLDGLTTPSNLTDRGGALFQPGKIRLTSLGLEIGRLARLGEIIDEPELDRIGADYGVPGDSTGQ